MSFPPSGRRFTLGPPSPLSRDNSWDTNCATYEGCSPGKDRLGYSRLTPRAETEGEQFLLPLVSVTVPFPVDQWAIYVWGLKPSPTVQVAMNQPPRIYIQAQWGADYACVPARTFTWDPLEFQGGQLLGQVGGLLSTTLELWGAIDPTTPQVNGQCDLNFRIVCARGGNVVIPSSDLAFPIIGLGPNVS